MTTNIEPPASDDLFDAETEADPEVEQLIEQARQFHAQIDSMKQWSHRAFAEMTARAAVLEATGGDESDVEELREVGRHLLTVADRIESGDTNRVRQP